MIVDLLANIVYTAALLTYGSTLSVPIEPTPLHGVATVETQPIASYFSSERKCRYSGLAVPYERDWETEDINPLTRVKSIVPAQPGEVEEIAIIINKKTCPGKEPERMLLQGVVRDKIWDVGGKGIGWHIMLTSVSQKEEERPKWFDQVLNVITAAKDTDHRAKEFLEYSLAGEQQF